MKKTLILTIMFFIFVVTNAFAGGFEFYGVGIKATSMGFNFTGVADNPTAMFWNPAGLTQLDTEKFTLTGETQFVYSDVYVEHSGGTDNTNTLTVIPEIFIGRSFGKWAAALGIYAPHAVGSFSYENITSPSANMGGLPVTDFDATVAMPAIGGSLAVEVTPQLSIGITAELFYSMLEMEMTTPMGKFKIEDDGFSGGRASIGMLYEAMPGLRLGANVKLPATLRFDGTQKAFGVKTNHRGIVELPWILFLGGSYQLTPDFLVSAQYILSLYGETDSYLPDPNNPQSVYDNIQCMGLGFEWKASPVLDLRGGLAYQTNGQKPENWSMLSLANAEGEAFFFNAGFSYWLTSDLSFDFVGTWIHYPDTDSKLYPDETYGGNAYNTMIGITYKF